jgi:DNA polymerase I
MDATKQFCPRAGLCGDGLRPALPFPAHQALQPLGAAFQERAAINAPIQGAAADVIRRAMIRMPGALKEAGLAARMLLQAG